MCVCDSGLYVSFYTTIRRATAKTSKSDIYAERTNFVSRAATISSNAAASVVAATLATIITQPPDVIRTKMQLQAEAATASSALSAFHQVVKSDGFVGLFKGVEARFVAHAFHRLKTCILSIFPWLFVSFYVRVDRYD